MASGSQNNTTYQAQKWTNLRAFTIGNTTKNVDGTAAVFWSKDEILGASTDAYFLRGDKVWSNALSANFSAGTYILAGTYLQARNHMYLDAGHFYMKYNNTWYDVLHNHVNGNVSVNAAGTGLYVGYYNTTLVNWMDGRMQLKDGCLSIFPNSSNYREGIRIHSVSNWSDITLCGNDNTGDSGISANSWFIGNNNGNFYIARNGSPGSTAYIGCVSNVWKFVTSTDIPEGAANLSAAATAHTLSIYRNGITIPYQMDNANDGGMLRVRGSSESNTILELGTWDDSGSGETIQFNYYPTTSQVTPTYSIKVPKRTGSIFLAQPWWTSGNGNNVNDLRGGSTFAYTNHNAPTNGMIVAFDCDGSESYTLQLQGNYSGEALYYRNRNGDKGTWNTWRQLVHNAGTWGISITGNAATATVWQTARTLTIGNKGQSVNGSANVSWTLNDILYNATTIGTSTSWDQAGPSVYYVNSSAAFTGTNHPGNNSEIMPYTYGQLIVSRAGSGGVLQIYAPHTGSSGAVNAGLRYRTGWNSAGWQTWSTLLDDRLWRKYIFCNKNINRSQLTVSDSTWNIIPSGAIDIFGLSFKDTALSNDTGDIRMWLQGKTTLHIQIDGAFHASEGFVGNASTATKLSNTPNNTTTFLRGDNTWTNTINNTIVCIPPTSNMAASNMAFNGGIQVRENGGVGNGQSAIEYGPRISFHWGNRVAKSITLHSNGTFYFRDQNGTTRSTIDANVVGYLTGNCSGNAATATTASTLAAYASIGSSTTDHGVALKNWFTANKSTAPRNQIISFYSATSGNGSQYMGYFLSGYANNPYGGFFVCHYNDPYYVGISDGKYTQQHILTSTNYTSYTVTKTGSGASGTWGINVTGSAGSVAWDNVSSKPATATRWPTWSEVTSKPAVQNNLTSTSTTDMLSAAQGKALNDNKTNKNTGLAYTTLLSQTYAGTSPKSISVSNISSYNALFFACYYWSWWRGSMLIPISEFKSHGVTIFFMIGSQTPEYANFTYASDTSIKISTDHEHELVFKVWGVKTP